jgi:predicted O-methyltransferase YrrM
MLLLPAKWKDRNARASQLTVLSVLLGAAAMAFAALFMQYRRRLHDLLGRGGRAPIPTVTLEEFDDVFRQGPLGPTLDAEVIFVGRGQHVPGGTSDREAWILACLARRRRNFFEFGTATGKTSYLWARNAPADAHVVTITLSPADHAAYLRDSGDSAKATRMALAESAFTEFLYSGTEVERRIEQLYGDSKQLETAPYRGRFDLIFVDGSHAYSYVESDTAKALEMLAPGGIIIWHDYSPFRAGSRDVFRFLNELHRTLPLVRLLETTMVAYRAPAA